MHTTVEGEWVNRAKLQEWIRMKEIMQQHTRNHKNKIQKQGVKLTENNTSYNADYDDDDETASTERTHQSLWHE